LLIPTTHPTVLQNKFNTFFGISAQILGTVFLARLIIDTGVRIVYPFIPQFSVGLGLTVVGFSWLIFARSIVGLIGPIFGPLADRYSRRKIMAASLLCQSVAAMGVAFSWQWWAVLPMLFFGLAPAAFFPASQAYISDKVVYQKRGRAMGTIEFAWAIAGIISLPIIGWMISTFGWQAPLLVLTLTSLLGAGLVWFVLPQVEHRSHLSLNRAEILQVWFRSNVLAAVGVSMLVFVAVSCLMTVWGIWLSTSFRLDAVALGLVATGIGRCRRSEAGDPAQGHPGDRSQARHGFFGRPHLQNGAQGGNRNPAHRPKGGFHSPPQYQEQPRVRPPAGEGGVR